MARFLRFSITGILFLAVAGSLKQTLAAPSELMTPETADFFVVTHAPPSGIEAASDYRVRAGGHDVFVYQSPVAALAPFSFSGRIDVTVETDKPIETVAIRPLSREIEAKVDGNRLHFSLDEPANLSIEIDGDISRPLFLFGSPIETDAPAPGDPGVVYFEGGRIHDAGEIRLEDGMTVYIAGGAVVRGTIRGNGVGGVRIAGRGILDATTRNYQTKMIELTECRDIDLEGILVLGSFGWTVVPRQSRDIRIANVKIVSWRNNDDGINVVGSRNVTIDGVFVRTKDDCVAMKATGDHRYFDPPSAAAGTPEARPVGTRTGEHDVRNVQVVNSVFWNAEWGNAMEIGFELRTPGIRDIVFRNCDIIRVERGAVFSVNNGDYAVVENIRFEDIRIEDARDRLLSLDIGLSIYSEDCPWEYFRSNPNRKRNPGGQWVQVADDEVEAYLKNRGHIRNIHLKDIEILAGELPPSNLRGFGHGRNIEGIVFENVRHRGRPIRTVEEARMTKEHTERIQFVDYGESAINSDAE